MKHRWTGEMDPGEPRWTVILRTEKRKVDSSILSLTTRLRQTRELIRIDSDLLAHASVLLGDLGQDQAARDYGKAALIGMQEAETSQAKACYALAKTARWQHNYAEAADLALRGFDHGSVTPMSVQLAYYEANSAALAGDISRARTALGRAEMFADARSGTDTGTPRGPSHPNGRRSSRYLSRCAPVTPTAHCGLH